VGVFLTISGVGFDGFDGFDPFSEVFGTPKPSLFGPPGPPPVLTLLDPFLTVLTPF